MPPKNKKKYFSGKRGGGPPRGGDGRGDFLGGPLAKYRDQPLPEMLSAPGISVSAVQGKERVAEREILEALEEAADELYPETKEAGAGGAASANDDEDIEDALKKELAELSGGSGGKSKRFRMTKRDSACVVYIVVLEPLDPVRLVEHILAKCESTARCNMRFVQRLTPIARTGPGNKTKLAELAKEILPAAFHTEDGSGLKFAINAHVRNSDKIPRLDMIKIVAEEVPKLNPTHSVDLKNPDRTILIELFRNVIGLSVGNHFEKYKKYNPSATAKDAAKALGIEMEGEGQGEGETTAAADGESGAASSSNNRAQSKAANRERRAAGIVAAQAAQDEAKERKRKADALDKPELEDGQVPRVEDVEHGEVVEDDADLGDDFVEVIAGGRATKVRREE